MNRIKKGDTVYVNAGNDKGKTGKVLEVITAKNRAIVEGVNMVSKHTKPNAKNPQGGIVKQEAGIHISNLQLIDPAKGGPTRVGFKINEDGTKVRVSKKSGEEIKYWQRNRQQLLRQHRQLLQDMYLHSRNSIRKRLSPSFRSSSVILQ